MTLLSLGLTFQRDFDSCVGIDLKLLIYGCEDSIKVRLFDW